MQINNKMSRFLTGPYIFFGFIFLVPGIMGLFLQHWMLSGINLFISWFLFGTYSGIEINTEKGIFRAYNCWFGLFKTGKWKTLDTFIGVTLVSMRKVHRMYSRSNRVNSSAEKEFRVYLVNQNKKPSIAINKSKSYIEAQKSTDEFSIWLKLPVFSVKR